MKKILVMLLCLTMLFCCGCTDNNLEELAPESEPEPDKDIGRLIISEVMTDNRSGLQDADGDFSPWLELQNVGEEEISLSSWKLTEDGEKFFSLPDKNLKPGETFLVFLSGKNRHEGEIHTDFRSARGESIYVYTPAGNLSESLELPESEPDWSWALEGESYEDCRYPTPGLENSRENFDRYQENLSTDSPLIINEVMTANKWGQFRIGSEGDSDWFELKNVSDQPINSADYFVSDSNSDLLRYRLPEKSLDPGQCMVFACEKSEAGFKLNSIADRLFLANSYGELLDSITLIDIPATYSYGRMNGENGGFYFRSPSPGRDNSEGQRRISDMPRSATRDGIYNDVEFVDVVLEGSGTIYYTTDSSLPTEKSEVYKEPIRLGKTTVIRARALQEGGLLSRPLTLSFIINENHSLPVLSISADDPEIMNSCYFTGYRHDENPGCACFYEGDTGFKINCGIQITGNNSRTMMKKSMKIDFRSAYGAGSLKYDLFDADKKEFSSLAVRAGQDNHRLIFRQEIWQDLCLQMTDKVPTQHSKFCILYLNGNYKGIYCLKEDISKDYFAEEMGVDPDSVESIKPPDITPEFEREIYDFCIEEDLSVQENYEYIENRLDIDALIDWVIIEGVSGNIDLFNNTRFFRSPECGGKWQPVLFDLDHSIINDYGEDFLIDNVRLDENLQFKALFGGSNFSSKYVTGILQGLIKNEEFLHKMAQRYSEVYDTVLSNENIIERMDYYEALLKPEVERDWVFWLTDPKEWPVYIDYVKTVINESDWERTSVENFCKLTGLSEADKLKYFP